MRHVEFLDFEILLDYLIQARRPDLVNKIRIEKNLLSCGFCRRQDENKRKWKDRQILGLCQRTEKDVEHEGQAITIVVGALEMVPKIKRGDWRNWKSVENQNHPDFSIAKIS